LSQHSSKIARFLVPVVLVCAASAGLADPARADGAFPEAQAVLLPSDRPKQIILATTFGLVFSDDDGATWSYACEKAGATQNGLQYSVGPPPQDRIYLSADGAPISADGGCTWRLGAGALVGMLVTDVFPDPVNWARVFAIAVSSAPTAVVSSVFRSLDGGATYADAMLTAPAGLTITGVESAASDPKTIYVTLAQFAGGTGAGLARSDDGGDSWSMLGLAPELGPVTPFLIAVDPTDPRHVFLRLVSGPGVVPDGETLAMTTDGGKSFTRALELPGGTISGFARLPDGAVVAATSTPAAGQAIYRSEDGGLSFVAMPVDFHPRGLGARGGVLFVAADDLGGDGFALASSADGGRTWRPRFSFAHISGVRACVKALCAADCEYQSTIKLFSKSVCVDKASASGCAVGDSVPGVRSVVAILGVGALGWLLRNIRRSRGSRKERRDG
jgi:photosystem II stability/assembly factor-like uncharacterized protein